MAGTDYHVHTARCGHAGGAMRDYVLPALANGLTEIAFTDHVPLYFLPGEDPDPDLAMTRAELPGYVEEVRALRDEFRGRIDVLLGLEADYAEGHEEALGELLAPYDWDVVLGSVHWVAGGWIDAPGSATRHETEGIGFLWREYYRLLAKACGDGALRRDDALRPPEEVRHHRPPECAGGRGRAPSRRRAKAGVAVEVSSAGLRKPVGEEYPAPTLLRRSSSPPACRSSSPPTPTPRPRWPGAASRSSPPRRPPGRRSTSPSASAPHRAPA